MSAKVRLALWVTFMVFLVSVMVLVFVLVINRHSLPEDPAEYLVSFVTDNANEVEFDRGTFEWDDLSLYRRGAYCAYYDADGKLLRAAFKEDMDFSDVPFKSNVIRTVNSGGREFYIYDHYVDMDLYGMWIRGAILTDSHFGITDVILRLTLMILPLILIVTFLGALWISSITFRPIEKIVDTANSINDADDLSGRIALKRGPKEMKQLAGAFDRMFERLEKLFDAERQFTSDASHELRTPTAVILAECDHAKRKDRSVKEYRESIGHIEEQGHRMSALIEELLGITRIQQGTEKYPLSKGDLSEFVSVTAEGFVPQDDRGISFETDIESGITCSFNPSLISRAVYNLLQNAYKYGREGGYVRLSLKRGDGTAELKVEDNGIGISAEDQEKIWQRFWQADTSRSEGGSSGLGLAMVKEIAALHGGDVSVKSAPGEGSVFTMKIPLEQQ